MKSPAPNPRPRSLAPCVKKGDSPHLCAVHVGPFRRAPTEGWSGTVPFFRGGFTLVELLVVVVIISILMGLLLPAIVAARARARIAECTNNQKELGSAILQYELAKKRLPGYANETRGSAGTITASWIPVLLKYMGRADLWEGTDGWRSGDPDTTSYCPYIKQLVCPDMPSTGGPALTYVVSVSVPAAIGPPNETGLFRDLAAGARSITLSDVKSTSQQPMISERMYYIGTNSGPPDDRQWSETGSNVTNVRYGFPWPENKGDAETTPISQVLPSIHPGIVIITFCDGRVQSVADDALCDIFAYQLFP